MLASAAFVTVLYAGSLVTPMEGPISHALATHGITFQGEGRGSREIANFVVAGLRNPDVVICVDPSIVTGLTRRGFVARSWTFGSATLGIGWTMKSRDFLFFDEVEGGRQPLADQLREFEGTDVRIARTDPRLDPKGAYTLEAMRMLMGAVGERRLLGNDENPAQVFPEQDLLVRLETGEADFGFVYSTEARARGLGFIPLPGRASLSDKIRYTVAILKGAPHPQAARAFVDFILHGEGRQILKNAGITYL
ncbi:MAG TPA: extracellular solute-binding protein [Candidatus Tyrphobacter sp.]